MKLESDEKSVSAGKLFQMLTTRRSVLFILTMQLVDHKLSANTLPFLSWSLAHYPCPKLDVIDDIVFFEFHFF